LISEINNQTQTKESQRDHCRDGGNGRQQSSAKPGKAANVENEIHQIEGDQGAAKHANQKGGRSGNARFPRPEHMFRRPSIAHTYDAVTVNGFVIVDCQKRACEALENRRTRTVEAMDRDHELRMRLLHKPFRNTVDSHVDGFKFDAILRRLELAAVFFILIIWRGAFDKIGGNVGFPAWRMDFVCSEEVGTHF
jgi:hypothetical protein